MKTFPLIVLIVLVYALLEYGLNLPQNAGHDVPDGKLNSLSFAPYREGQSPLDRIFPTAEEIESDLQLMAQKTRNIRTYASAEGAMPVIPTLARKYGLTLLQGAWLDADKERNKKEISELIHSANANPDVVKRVIVGNEVLLRGDLEPEQLIEYLREVQRSIKQPVSYADVWSMYMKYPQLIKEVDFVTIHILPYWEDEPIAVDAAPAHIERIFKQVQKEAHALVPNIPILIGESGWPSAGRQRGYAVPGVVNEAKFIRGLIKVANDNGFDYNIVEAFNQSWKSALEGVVGANWGMYSVDRKEVFPLTGRVYEHPNWLKNTLIAIGLFLIAAGACWKKVQKLSTPQQFGWLFLMLVFSVLVVKQSSFLWYTSYSDWQRLVTSLIVAFNILLSVLILYRAYYQLLGQSFSTKCGNGLYYLFFTFAILAIYRTLGLAINGRYISFPTLAAYVPVVGLLALTVIHYVTATNKSLILADINVLTGSVLSNQLWNRMLGYVLLLSIFLLVMGETKAFVTARDLIQDHSDFDERISLALLFTLSNGQLLAWMACLGVLAFPFWISGRRAKV